MVTAAASQLSRNGQASAVRRAAPSASAAARGTLLDAFLRAQALNAERHATALRPFRPDEFGTGAASPSDAHIRAANRLIVALRAQLADRAARVRRAADAAGARPDPAALQTLLGAKDDAGEGVKHVERTWDFYFELFGQRQSRYGDWLLATDRIALDCYQAVYTGLARARSVPAPPPFSFMATGFTPATYRRGIRLTRIGRHANPFPIVELPYHRLVNPWTLGAVHHEVAHNIQSDLGLWEDVPRRIERRLRDAGLAPALAELWARWNKEIWADLCGLLLGGPAIVASLMDVVAQAPERARHFTAGGVHPTPYLRVPINLALLRRMGFGDEATTFGHLWDRLYPADAPGAIPRAMRDTFPRATELVVDTICYQAYPQLGGKTLAGVTSFNRTHDAMTWEAATRLGDGIDPGIVPARFLVGAARWAIDNELAPPGRIAVNFYRALLRR